MHHAVGALARNLARLPARDLLALAKQEVSEWDTWRAAPVENHDVDPTARVWCDEVAALLSDVDLHLSEIRSPPQSCEVQLRPFWKRVE